MNAVPAASAQGAPPMGAPPIQAAPGPRGRFLLGSLPEFARDVLSFFTDCVREHGDFVQFRIPGYRMYFLNRPQDIEQILLAQRTNFIKHRFFWRHVTAIFGNGLLTSEGEFWLRQRRLAAPAFHPDRIAAYGEVMVRFAGRAAESWRPGEIRHIHQDMMRLTMQIVSKTLFDVEIEEEVEAIGRSFDLIIREIARRFRRPVRIPDAIPTPGNRRYRRGVVLLDKLVERVLRERRNRPGDRGDLLSMLLEVRDEDGQPMSDKQLRDELITLFLAGHETTALSLSWTFFLLSRHPDARERMGRELREAADSPDSPFRAQDLPRLPYTEAVVKESLRLYPPAYAVGREALADCVIGGYAVPAGATVFFSPWVLQRDSRWFADPGRFRPERWLDGSTAQLPKYIYIPFGGGPRVCIGERFAMMEAVLVLATIGRRFELEMAGPDPTPFQSITLRPEGGPIMRVRSSGI
jgi:cytochrome P450